MKLQSASAVGAFISSQPAFQLYSFIRNLGRSVQGCRGLSVQEPQCEILVRYGALLDRIGALDAEVTLDESRSRYGNIAFRTFAQKLEQELPVLLADMFTLDVVRKGMVDGSDGDAAETRQKLIDDFTMYLRESFGNEVRIDYGSGHELNFVCSLYVLHTQPGWLKTKAELCEAVKHVFVKYLELARTIQRKYRLEPAGSRGVWGLDDHQFIPFWLGAYQLVGNPDGITPADAVKIPVAQEQGDTYLYVNCVRHILRVKPLAPFHETSPMLWDISGAASWEKIAGGFDAMFSKEVFGAFPVMQHFNCGHFLPPC